MPENAMIETVRNAAARDYETAMQRRAEYRERLKAEAERLDAIEKRIEEIK